MYVAAFRATDGACIARKAMNRRIEIVARDWRGNEPFFYALCRRVGDDERTLHQFAGTPDGLAAAQRMELEEHGA